MKTADIRARSEKVLTRLAKSKLTVGDPYRRAPFATEIATLNLSNANQVRFWNGHAEVDVFGDRKHRQAVVVVAEEEREITRRVGIWNRSGDKPSGWQLRQSFPISIPNAHLVHWEDLNVQDDPRWGRHYYDVTMEAPAATNHFLVGYDESSQFIAALPEAAESVEHAHEILRPEGVPADALRQGEWFFVPATKDESKRCWEKVTRRPDAMDMRRFERFSTHRGTTVLLDKQRFAIGVVHDTRRSRHHPLMLPDWHKVVRNREIVSRNVTGRNWD